MLVKYKYACFNRFFTGDFALKTMLVKYKFRKSYRYLFSFHTLKTMLVKYKYVKLVDGTSVDGFKNNAC